MFMPEEFPSCGDIRSVIPKSGNEDESVKYVHEDYIPLISHAFRTPITSVRSLSEILLNNPDIDVLQRQKYLSIIINEADRLAKLVDQIVNTQELRESGKQVKFLKLNNKKREEVMNEVKSKGWSVPLAGAGSLHL